VCEDTIEERIEALLNKKRILFSQVVDELADIELKQVLSEEELFGLFGLTPPIRSNLQASSVQQPGNPVAQMLASTKVISPQTPLTNVIHLREIIRGCDVYLDWVDLHLGSRALEEIVACIDPARVRTVRLLSGPANVDDRCRRDFRRFKDELSDKGIQAEWRVIEKPGGLLHDRFIVSESSCWNVPPINALLQGSYSQLNETDKRPPFEDWWTGAASLI
jgi:hypothetical protein